LKICDTLQEWNKPRASDETDIIAPSEIELILGPNTITIKKFSKKKDLEEKFSRFFIGNDIIQI
jgi:hypothetical protein